MTVIFPDVAAHPRDYAALASNELLITKIFPTVQGEGPFAGRRCVFVRLAGCNLGGKSIKGPGCDFCDTDFRLENGRQMTFQDIYNRIVNIYPKHGEYAGDKKKLVVVTGGEPMLQANLVSFLASAPAYMLFQIETNGTHFLQVPLTRVHVVVSPKIPVPMAGVAHRGLRYPRLNKEVLDRTDSLKFVVANDYKNPYHAIPEYADRFLETGKTVYVSPMAVYLREPLGPANAWDHKTIEPVETAMNYAYAGKLAMQRGFTVSIQQHLFMHME